MRWRLGLSGWLAILVACITLWGCAVVDEYSGRAVVYNLEAEQAQDQALLLNIVRAYLQRPMQFTTVSSITGVASVSGGAQYTLPTHVPFRPITQGPTGIAAFPALPTWQLSGSMSGGPAFTVPVLDTQEFYQGILRAIPGQIWDLYIQANYPPDLLFNLLVEKVVMKRTDDLCPEANHLVGCEFTFVNSVTSGDVQIDLFQALADYLLALGLTTEASTAESVSFTNPTNINVRYVGAPRPGKANEAQVVAPPAGSSASDAPAAPKSYKICFEPRTDGENKCISPKSLCGERGKSPKSGSSQAKISETPRTCDPRLFNRDSSSTQNQIQGSASVNVIASREFVERLIDIAGHDELENEATQDRRNIRELQDELRAFELKPVKITIYMRHTEGMIYYLGTLVRRSLGNVQDHKPRDIIIRLDKPYRIHQEKECTEGQDLCAYVFHLREGTPEAGDIVGVNYEGQRYSIPGPTSAEIDLSSLTFDILKQLIALNSSAKSLPQSSVLSVVGGQ